MTGKNCGKTKVWIISGKIIFKGPLIPLSHTLMKLFALSKQHQVIGNFLCDDVLKYVRQVRLFRFKRRDFKAFQCVQITICDTQSAGGDNQIYNDVWGRFVPGTTEIFHISTLGLAGYDTKIAVYTGLLLMVDNG